MDIPRNEPPIELQQLHDRVKTFLESGVESETKGKWLFSINDGMNTLRFSLAGHRISMGGVWGQYRTISDRLRNDQERNEEARQLLQEIYDCEQLHRYIENLLFCLVMHTSPADGVYEFDPINGGTDFVKTNEFQPFID